MSISDTPTSPDPSSVLDISSTSKGLLIPRMTSTQRLAIVNPSNALMVFDTDSSCILFYKSSVSQWYSMCDYTQGPVGPQGDPGVHVDMANVDGNGDLIVTLSDGTVINAGYVVGSDGILVHKEIKVPRAQMVQMVLMEQPVHKVHKDYPAQMVLMEQPVHKVHKDYPAQMVLMEQPVHRVHKDYLAQMVLMVRMEQPVHKVPKDYLAQMVLMVLMEQRVHKVHKDYLVQMVLMVLTEQLVHKVHKDYLVQMVLMVLMEQPVHKVHKDYLVQMVQMVLMEQLVHKVKVHRC